LWICLSRLWRDWRSALAIVKPETVVAWHRAGFRLFWTWKVRHGQPGRPLISREVRDLIRKMCQENPAWGAPGIHGELLKLGIDIGESSVSKYMVRCSDLAHISQESRQAAGKGNIQQYEKKWLDLPWQKVRESVEVKLFEQDGELYVLAKSAGRRAKETAMRRKRLVRLLKKNSRHAPEPPFSGPAADALGCREIGSRPRVPFCAGAGTRGRPGGHAGDLPVSCG
jgi:hypothetical protein